VTVATRKPRFRPNRKGIGQMLRSPQMEAAMRARAQRIKEKAQADAPVDSGTYAASFEVDSTREGGVHGDRAEARVINTAPHAVAVEFGTSTTPAHRTLGRAAEGA
jgi:HK97 gp10 family phage protein